MCNVFFLACTYTPRVMMDACVTLFTNLAVALAQEPDKCALSRARFCLSHLSFHSLLTLVLMKRQGLTYIHPSNRNENIHQPPRIKRLRLVSFQQQFSFSVAHILLHRIVKLRDVFALMFLNTSSRFCDPSKAPACLCTLGHH